MYPIDLDAFVTGTRDDRDRLYGAARRAMWEGDLQPHDSGAARYYALSRMAYDLNWAEDRAALFSWPIGEAPPRVRRVIAWLEEDPFACYTGYEKQRVLRRLRRFTFAEPEAEALRHAILAMLQRGPRMEFRDVRRLARRVDSPAFRDALVRLAQHADPGTAERARLTLGLCQRNDDGIEEEASGDQAR